MDLNLLGTDLSFFTAFLTAFLFNWVGFLLLMCFCHTIAARYGALAGFGLSLAKWTLIVKRSTELVRDENAWLWWLVLAFGFLICVRACTQVRSYSPSQSHMLLKSSFLLSVHPNQKIVETSFILGQRASFLLLLNCVPILHIYKPEPVAGC